MKSPFVALGALLLATAVSLNAQTASWEGIHGLSLSEAEANFAEPPVEFASNVIWGWEGQMDIATMRHDLDSIKSKGFRSVIFEAGYNLPYEYLSDDWFKAIRTAVLEAKARGLKVWIIDEGKYPSGFAGGKFTRERPELRMQALVVVDRVELEAGQSIEDFAVPPGVISAVAVSHSGKPDRIVEVKDSRISFTADDGERTILLAGPDFRTGQTRAVNNPDGRKDTSNSLCDYLNPVAVSQFIDWTHEQYKKYLGEEFGVTVLGFRGDEPDYAHTPWTPAMVEEFISRKGYDPTPYLATLFSPNRSVMEQRFRADYWDVWSELFSVNFFKQQADWCAENGLAHITHLNNDHNMPVCIRAGGNLFRDLSKVQIPGVDAIWNQIWPETVNDFPKFASSVSHVYGKPRVYSESFAAYYTSPSIAQAKYVVDHQMLRGINFFEFMFWMAGSRSSNWMTDPGMKDLNAYTNRATYLNSLGVPGARIAVYYPTATFWLDNDAVNPDLVEIAQLLLRHQRDFDWVDDDAFTEALSVSDGTLVNLSGQSYGTLIIPSCDVITSRAWSRIEEFASSGGKVLFWGRKPTMLASHTFTEVSPLPDTPEWLYEPAVRWTAKVEAAMPVAEMRILEPKEAPFIRYTRRCLNDGDIYLLFNEGEETCTFGAVFDAKGEVRLWDASSGKVTDMDCKSADGVISFSLEPWESLIISISR